MPRPALALALASILLIPTSCAHHDGPKSDASTHIQPAPSGTTKLYIMQSGGRDVLRLIAPADAPCTLADGSFDMKSRDGYVNIWLVRGAKTIDEGVQRAAAEITSEFKDFKPTRTTTLALSNHATATRLLGAGLEADDNDPGTADVIVFQAGPRIFIACTHGETMRPTAQDLMLNLVQSASAP